jgi:hypothetical protein
MTVSIKLNSMIEFEQLQAVCAQMGIGEQMTIADDIIPQSADDTPQPSITKGDKTLDPFALVGIWQDNPITIEDLRAKAWKRGTNL